MQKLTTISTMAVLALTLAGCFESGSEATVPPAVPLPPVGVVVNGSTYYQEYCGTCHSAGTDDTSTAFGASDLAQRQDMIAPDMSDYDGTSTFNLMLSFSAVPAQRVADLKAYLSTL